MRIKQKFKAHPIGQGFFYSGQLKSDNAEFNFVFDCGSLSYSVLNNTIDRFQNVDSNDNKDLDLLVISHFDKDHINGLQRLLAGRKVKNIIAPFINFNQRLSIALAYVDDIEDTEGLDPNLDNTIGSILDFTSVISDSIDESTKFFFINGNDKDTPPDDTQENFEKEVDNIDSFSFDFGVDEGDCSPEDIAKLRFSKGERNFKKVDCNNIGSIKGNFLKVLDLIFYRKKVGENDSEFFEKVYKRFIEEFMSKKDEEKYSIDEIKEQILKIKGSPKISKLFKKAAKDVEIDLTITNISNLNTTALCMLHVNKIHQRTNVPRRLPIVVDFEFNKLQIFNNLEIKIDYLGALHFHHFRRYFREREYFFLMNTMLTSDSFLKEKQDVDNYISYYNSYWRKVNIFQIPHHGSKKNSDKYLFSQLHSPFNFINYGLNHNFIKTWSHPDDEVIIDLIATEHSNKIIPVNEYSGYEIEAIVHIN